MKTSHITFLITILVIASCSTLTHGLILNGLRIASININGLLFCSIDGNRIGNSPPLSGALVQLTCAGSNTNLGQVLTNRAGAFVIPVRLLNTILFDPSTCFVKVINIPVATCSVFPTRGDVRAPLNLVGIVRTVLGNIANFNIGPFANIL